MAVDDHFVVEMHILIDEASLLKATFNQAYKTFKIV
jgi:hypothetical protein